jgi:hypothetical protein
VDVDVERRYRSAAMGPDAVPRPPFADWPVQGRLGFGFVWFTAPGAIVTQATVEHGTLAHAMEITDVVDRIVQAKHGELAGLGGVLILHDWKFMRSYDPQGRNHIFSRTRERRAGEVRAIVVSLTLTPIVRMSIEAGNALLRATTGRVVDVVPSIGPSLARHGVQRPEPGVRLPGAGTSLRPSPRE